MPKQQHSQAFAAGPLQQTSRHQGDLGQPLGGQGWVALKKDPDAEWENMVNNMKKYDKAR
jgi:hypothetical protein